MSLRHLRHALEPSFVASEVRRVLSKMLRKAKRLDHRVVTLEPDGPPRGEVLFSYILDPFLLRSPERILYSHTHFWESFTMARTFVEQGFRVDAVAWTNPQFTPLRPYTFVLDVRHHLEQWAPLLPNAVKIAHLDTAHHSFHNAAQEERLSALAVRRGQRLRPEKLVTPNRLIETADIATLLGNSFTRDTYAFAGKPMRRIPISVPFAYPWQDGKDFAAIRRRFLWFGSGGLVHKGLDLVLEAFAGLPDCHLTVCGPIRREKDFERAYFKELYETPNIHTLGWIDVGSPAFLELARNTLGLVYPSCSEGGGSSALTCMHAGLIPIVTHETSIDVAAKEGEKRGVILEDLSVDGIRTAISELAEQPGDELEAMARRAWSFVRQHHTKERFQEGYRKLVEQLIDGTWRQIERPGHDR